MGTALDSFGINMTWLALLVPVSILLLFLYKYSIDTKLTIKELAKDRDLYRSRLWMLMLENGKKHNRYTKANLENDFYKNIKNKIVLLRKDLSETNFDDYQDIKQEILSALKDIESYGEGNDTDKN